MHKNIRAVFSLSALILIVIIGMRVSAGAWSATNWGMLAISALVCLLVFRCFVFVFNFSYSLACLLNALLIATTSQSMPGWLLGGAMALYGLRLLLFTWRRTYSDSYASRMDRIRGEHDQTPAFVRVVLWVQCSVVYTFHLFGVYIAAQQAVVSLPVLAGGLIILGGIVLEATADAQKQSAKAVAPDAFVRTGLYRRWRHPNFIGEIVVQLGLIVVGLGVASTWGNMLAVLVTPVYIVILMIYQCRQVDVNMGLRYGDQPDFVKYLKNSGSLLPHISSREE